MALPAALILDVTVNGRSYGLSQFQSSNGVLLASRATLRRIGLRAPAEAGDPIRLAALPGLHQDYSEAGQTLNLMAPVTMLDVPVTKIGATAERTPGATSSTGLLLNNDVYANITPAGASFNGFTELRAFSGNMVLNSTGLVSYDGGVSGDPGHLVRLDSAWSASFPDSLLTLRVGDTLTAATSWSRATRIGGIQIGTNFALQPYLVTAPLPSFIGSATMPSQVELYIDGVKRYSNDVPAGPFSLNMGSTLANGAANAQLVMTNVLGVVSTLNFPIYEAPQLLGQGISDWSAEIGTVRRNYGVTSFDYGSDPLASATWRDGLTDWLTVEAHGEADRSAVDLGLGGIWQVGTRGGIVSASLAASQAGGHAGYQWSAGYSWNNQRFGFNLQAQMSSPSYADVAAGYSGRPPREQGVGQISYNTKMVGAFSLNYVRSQSWGSAPTSYAGLQWSKAIGSSFSLNLSFNQNTNDGNDRILFLTLNYTPRSEMSASTTFAEQRGAASETVSVQQNLPQSGGLGWRLDASHNGDASMVTGQADYLTSLGQLHAQASGGDAIWAGTLGYSGSVALMADHLFIGRRVDDGFAVVSTGEEGDVPVKLENNVVGRTDEDGLLLVPQLRSYQRNTLMIDTTDLPATAKVEQTSQVAVPADRSGVMVRFPIASFSALIMTLVDGDGNVVPEGGAIRLKGRENDEPLIVGFDGQVYLESPEPGTVLSVEWPGGSCQASLPTEVPAKGIVRLGTVRCLSQKAEFRETPK